MDEIECPKCGYVEEAIGPDDDAGERTCDGCGFRYVVEIEYDPVYW